MDLDRLGITGQRAVVTHVDDLGASHGANQAFLDLSSRGLVTCGSVMVPGPWFREIADVACGDSSLDLGVHLTLTSEWKACRWAPISTVSVASGLIDGDGYFWSDLRSLQRNLVPEAAEIELRAQIERAIASGFRPTHIDAHMAGAMLPQLLRVHVALGREYGLFPVLPRSITWAPDPEVYASIISDLDAGGAPVVDHCRGTIPVDPVELDAAWTDLTAHLLPGLTHLALHCTAPGDFTAMAADHAIWRTAEYRLIASGRLRELFDAHSISVIGTRDLQALWLAQTGVVHGEQCPVQRDERSWEQG